MNFLMDRGMRIFGFLVIFLLLLETVNSFVCYACSSSNSALCLKDQQQIECRRYEDECITMITETEMQISKNKTRIKKSFSKGCADGRYECQENCQFYKDQGRVCKAECCQGNECNKRSATTNINRNKRNSYNSSFGLKHNWYLSLACIASILYFFLI